MNNVYDILKKLNIHPIAYQKIKSVYLIKDKRKKYIIKLNTNNFDIYKYLLSKDFTYFPDFYNTSNDNYDVLEYIEDFKMNRIQKIIDYLKILAILHLKTSYKREIDLNEIKEKYEELINEINYLRNYYLEINDRVDKEMFLSPSSYLLVCNISLIYSTLSICEERLNKIYQTLKKEKSIRISLLHNNLLLDHLITNNKEYLISWDKAYFDSPIVELENFYRLYYQDITVNDFFKIYESSNKLTNIEKELLLIKLSIPKKIEFTNNDYLNTLNVNLEINYLKDVYDLLVSFKE